MDLCARAWEPVLASFATILGEDLYPPSRRRAGGYQPQRHLVSVTGELVSGFVNVTFDEHERAGEISMIAVDTDAQRQGIATRLTELALDEMRARGINLATVATGGGPGHAPARRTYELVGFTACAQVWYAKLLDEPAAGGRR